MGLRKKLKTYLFPYSSSLRCSSLYKLKNESTKLVFQNSKILEESFFPIFTIDGANIYAQCSLAGEAFPSVVAQKKRCSVVCLRCCLHFPLTTSTTRPPLTYSSKHKPRRCASIQMSEYLHSSLPHSHICAHSLGCSLCGFSIAELCYSMLYFLILSAISYLNKLLFTK